jgi:hypothetical protein
VKVDIELKSLVSRIKGVTSQIKQKVRKQKEMSESFVSERDVSEEDEDNFNDGDRLGLSRIEEDSNMHMAVGVDNLQSIDEVSIILPSRPKSGNVTRGRAGLLSQGNYNSINVNEASQRLLSPTGLKDFGFPDEHQEPVVTVTPGANMVSQEVLERVIEQLKTRHRAEKDALQVELQVFKAVIEGMASKIRYLQEYKLDREQIQIALFKHRHLNERLQKDSGVMATEVRRLTDRLETMKRVMLEFDHEYLNVQAEENNVLEQLMVENSHLRKLLNIHENHGVME